MFSLRSGSGSFREDEIELPLLRTRKRRCGAGNRGAQRPQEAQSPLDPVGSNGGRNGKQITTGLVSFVSFHGGIMKQGVGHRLSEPENNLIFFRPLNPRLCEAG